MVNATLDNAPAATQCRRVMIVDDEPIVVKVLGLYLRHAGFSDLVTTTESKTTVEMIRAFRPDLVLLDINMPVVSGWDILAEILADPLLGGLRVIVISGDSAETTRTRALALGAKAILWKPIKDTALVAAVQAVCGG
ncbi:MAG: response regulator [Thermoguttaceae bacterium]|jgi:CheY-like chemotaxis protein